MLAALADVTVVGLATVQDGGRRGYTDVGVPVAGAWHQARYAGAVQLITGALDPTCPSIEVLAGTLSLRPRVDLVIAVTGPATLAVGGRLAATGVGLAVGAEDEIVVTPAGSGPVYVAVSGWQPIVTLGSCSVDTFSRLGGEPIAVGDTLTGSTDVIRFDRVGWFRRPDREPVGPVRFVPADPLMQNAFGDRRWRVHSTARSGTRLRSMGWQGPDASVESLPVVPGAIQVTPDGEAIVLGPDGALTGGYPVVGVVATVDLDRISTFAVDSHMSFVAVDPDAAARAWAEDASLRARPAAHPALLD